MATTQIASMLDELMGRNRNFLSGDSKARELKWTDPDVCRYFLVDFCPHDLFTNTKADLGPCTNIHDEDMKQKYKDDKDNYKKSQYQDDFLRFCQRMLSDLQNRIKRSKERLLLTQENEERMLNAGGTGVSGGLNAEGDEQVVLLSEKIAALISEAEQAGNQGNVEQAQGLMKLCDQLREERESLIRSLLPANAYKDEYNVQPKAMETCETCGAFLIVGDAQQRLKDHLLGKQHMGFARLRAAIEKVSEEMKKAREEREKEVEEKRKLREEEDSKKKSTSEDRKKRDGSRDEKRHRSRSRDRGSSHRKSSRSRERRRRSRERSPVRERRRSAERRHSRSRGESRRSRSPKGGDRNQDRRRRSQSRDRERRKDASRSRSRDRRRRAASRSRSCERRRKEPLRSRSRDRRRKDTSRSRSRDRRRRDPSRSRSKDRRRKDTSRSRSRERRRKDTSRSRSRDRRRKETSRSRSREKLGSSKRSSSRSKTSPASKNDTDKTNNDVETSPKVATELVENNQQDVKESADKE